MKELGTTDEEEQQMNKNDGGKTAVETKSGIGVIWENIYFFRENDRI